jgi:uncharacterized damage-inducible protein DinB
MRKILAPDDEKLLKMKDVVDVTESARVMAQLQSVRDRLYDHLESSNEEELVNRPSPNKWSVVEILRHLIFAEDLYLNRWILQNEEPWLQIGLLPDFWKNDPNLSDVGKKETTDLREILECWANLHEKTVEFSSSVTAEILRVDTGDVDCGRGTIGANLQQLADHDVHHIKQIEQILA